MINSIRNVRRAKQLTLEDVAARCVPPTTAQTIGRLETGTRTLTIDWLNRIAAALAVPPHDLVAMPNEDRIAVAALLGPEGAHAPTRGEELPPLHPEPGSIGVRVVQSCGDYRRGDLLWCHRVARDGFARALNRDVLVPRPAGRFIFGRLLALDDEKMQILPLIDGARQQIVPQPEWVAVTARLIRSLGA